MGLKGRLLTAQVQEPDNGAACCPMDIPRRQRGLRGEAASVGFFCRVASVEGNAHSERPCQVLDQ
jgi:hypothetical protein